VAIRRASILAAYVAAIATPAAARDLPVPPDKGWQHAASGLVLTATIDGLRRTLLTDATASERDVAANFDDPAAGISATVYIFHPAVDDVALWFDRSRTALEDRNIFRNASPASADPVAFAAPGSSTASSLRQTYAAASGPFRSTTLSVSPVGDWLVVIRLSARTLNADALDARLSRFTAAIRWPRETTQQPVAVPIRECTTPLTFTKAKPAKPNNSDMLATLLMSGALANAAKDADKPAPRPTWCRQGAGRVAFGVYRSDPTAQGYTLALSDAGRVVHVAPSLMAQVEHRSDYGVTLIDVDDSSHMFGSFATLPQPEQVYAEIASGKSTGSAKGKTITIDPTLLQ
jgi:opacity protein-like surface antigen